MKMPSKTLILPMCALALVAAGSFGVAQVSAASETPTSQTSIVDKLASTFNLDKSKVQAVFDEQHKTHQADRQAKYEERLDKAVADGKLTADQKTKILAKHNELKTQMETAMKDNADATKEERRAAMTKLHTEAKEWAEANDIDAKWLLMGGPGKGGHGMGGMRGHHDPMGDTAPTPAS